MSYRHLSLQCHCGQTPERIAEVGFTDDHCLVIQWWCIQCQEIVHVTKPLADCWRDCPSPGNSQDCVFPNLSGKGYLEDDAEFLRSIGVQV
jgi:hypothetical protein